MTKQKTQKVASGHKLFKRNTCNPFFLAFMVDHNAMPGNKTITTMFVEVETTVRELKLNYTGSKLTS